VFGKTTQNENKKNTPEFDRIVKGAMETIRSAAKAWNAKPSANTINALNRDLYKTRKYFNDGDSVDFKKFKGIISYSFIESDSFLYIRIEEKHKKIFTAIVKYFNKEKVRLQMFSNLRRLDFKIFGKEDNNARLILSFNKKTRAIIGSSTVEMNIKTYEKEQINEEDIDDKSRQQDVDAAQQKHQEKIQALDSKREERLMAMKRRQQELEAQEVGADISKIDALPDEDLTT
jgi:hypothetical protein